MYHNANLALHTLLAASLLAQLGSRVGVLQPVSSKVALALSPGRVVGPTQRTEVALGTDEELVLSTVLVARCVGVQGLGGCTGVADIVEGHGAAADNPVAALGGGEGGSLLARELGVS